MYTMSPRPKVLILGAGFAGLGAATKLKTAPVDVVLVDKHDYHTFQPLIYQVATDLLAPQTVAHPMRTAVERQPNLKFVKASVSDIDLESKTVSFKDWEDQTYDYLVVALGTVVNFFGTTGAEENAFPIYTLNDAVRVKNHMLRLYEDSVKAGPDSSRMLDTVIVGGGPTGVEMAGAVAHLIKLSMGDDAPGQQATNARITLVEHADRLLTMFDESMSAYAKEELERIGVTVRLGEMVSEIGPESVTLATGEEIHATTTIWGAGLKTTEIVSKLSDDLQHGRVPVGPMLNLKTHPEVHVIGDQAWITDAKTQKVLPQLGSVAMQAGEQVGKNIDRITRKHKDPEPFHYRDKGSMATIGKGAAVAQLPPNIKLTGRPAFLLWGTVHLALLTGGGNRAAAATNWFITAMSKDRPSQVLIDPSEEE